MSNDVLRFTCPIEIQAADVSGKAPRVSIVAYNGGPMRLSGFGETVIDLAGLDLPPQVPLLADHDGSLLGIVGHGQPLVKGGRLLVEGQLATTGEAASQITALAKSGLLFQASVGVIPTQREYAKAGSTVAINNQNIKASEQGLIVVHAGTLKEISIVALAADNQTSVKIAASQTKKRSHGMTTENTTVITPDELKAAWDQPGLADADRIQLRAGVCEIQDPRLQQEARGLLTASATFEDYDNALLRIENRDLHLQRIKAERPRAPAVYGSARDMSNEVIEAAFCIQAGIHKPEDHFDEQTLDAATSRQNRNVGLQSMLLQAAAANGCPVRIGESIHRGNIKEILGHALPPGPIQASMPSTHSITTMLSNTANKMLLDGFNAQPQKWREVATTKSVKDFKQATAYRMTADLEYEELAPAGEITHGTLGQESYTMQAKTYAKMLALTRTDIINDDLGAFDDLRTRLGIGSVIKMNRVFWTLWVNNSTFFTDARNNYQEGAPTALAEAGLNTAVKLFRDLTGPDGNQMDLEPAVLLVPTDLEATALKWCNSTEIRDTTASTKTPTDNIYHGRFKSVAVPQLGNSGYTGYSALAWYLLADPKLLATAAMCFLDGVQAPTIESADADFNTLGIQCRGYHDFGVTMTEYRAGVKSKGEA